jgi:hypothetical protein
MEAYEKEMTVIIELIIGSNVLSVDYNEHKRFRQTVLFSSWLTQHKKMNEINNTASA